MTYIFDMAEGTEYLGDEMQCPKPSTAPAAVSPARREQPHCQVELRLAEVATEAFNEQRTVVPPGLDLSALIDALD